MFKFFILAFLITKAFAQSGTIVLTEDNSVTFNQPVRDAYVARKQLEIIQKSYKLPSTQPIYLVLDTPGGSVTDGLIFIDTIKSLNRPVHTITIFAASMGYQMVQELGTRYITPSGTLMSHRGAVGGLAGQIPGELVSRLGHIQSLLLRMNQNAAKRLGMSVAKYQESIVHELWSFGKQAVDTKQADQVVNVRCTKELISKTITESVDTMFGPIDVQFSACPLITSPVSFGSSNVLSGVQKKSIENELRAQKRRINLTY